MIELPDKKKCYNLTEQVAQNLRNITFLAEQYKNIDALPAIWQEYKEEFDRELETFGEWTTTFEGWDTTLSTYLANMSSAAIGAIAGQSIAPANVAATGNITANSIIENMAGYSFNKSTSTAATTYDYIYAGIVKNGNKLTAVLALNVTKTSNAEANIGVFNIPYAVAQKLIPTEIGGNTPFLARGTISVFQEDNIQRNIDYYVFKDSSTSFYIAIYTNNLDVGKKTYVRFEFTFLLSDNLAA